MTLRSAEFTQISPERDVTGNAFSKGVIKFKWSLHSRTRWNPYKSHIRMRIRLRHPNPRQLKKEDGIAPNMFMGDCFWQQMSAECDGVVVSSIDDYAAQIAALKHRYTIGEDRRKNFYNKLNFGEESLNRRINEVSVNGFEDDTKFNFVSLSDNAGTFILGAEEYKTDADTNVLLYRANGDGGAGAVDLRETALGVGDHIIFEGVANNKLTSKITAIGQSQITITNNPNVIAANQDISDLYYTKSQPSRRVQEFEIIFKPAMGLFYLNQNLPGNWTLNLYPHGNGNWQKYVIESLTDATLNTDYTIEVLNMELFLWKGYSETSESVVKTYEFNEIRCSGQSVVNGTLLNKAFVINPTSHTFSIAFQASNAGTDSSLSRTRFKVANNYDLQISRFQLRLGGNTIPTPPPSIEYTEAGINTQGKDFSSQQYMEQLQYLNSIYLDNPENLTLWQRRGPHYTYKIPIEVQSQDNTLNVSTQFNGAFPGTFSILVFDHFIQKFQLTIQNGMVTGVKGDILN